MKEYQYRDVNHRGRIERVTYASTGYAGEPIEKYANVYLPKDYDTSEEETRYNVLYCMHGGGGNPDAWLDCCKIKNMLDYSIDTGEAKPLIVVFPTYYKSDRSTDPEKDGAAALPAEGEKTRIFQKELVDELIPAVEGKYRTFAGGTDREAIRASRLHRAFTGFSMGGCTTWYAFIDSLDYISTFLPLSGDCWVIEMMGGRTRTAETAAFLHDFAKNSGYAPSDYRIFAATGRADIAFDALTPQVEEMKKYPDTFIFDEDYSKGSFHYLLAEEHPHAYESVYEYLYNFLPYLF